MRLKAVDDENTTISTPAAISIAHRAGKTVTVATLHKWIDNYNRNHDHKLGHQPNGIGGRYYIFKLRFVRFINGEED